jgi:hypothetical protein
MITTTTKHKTKQDKQTLPLTALHQTVIRQSATSTPSGFFQASSPSGVAAEKGQETRSRLFEKKEFGDGV